MDAQQAKRMDGGWRSRKLWYSIGTSLGVFLSGAVAAHWPAFQPSLDTVVGGLIGVLALYLGSNTVTRHVLTRNGLKDALRAAVDSGAQQAPDDDEAKPEPQKPDEK